MRKMKDSGIAWIGEIPETWKVGRIKYNYYLKGRIGWQGLKSSEFIDEGPYLITGTDFEDNKVVWSRCYHISPERYAEAPEIHVKKGDLLVTKDGTVGKIAYIDSLPGEASLNSHLLIMRPLNPDYSNRFLKWVIQSDEFEQFMKLSQNGTIMSSLSQEKISQFSFAIPCVQEQDRLADGLEEHCAKTDAAMRTEQALIDQLTDYKQSLITETVTKGLHPEVARKDSGVEWIGDIPKAWKIIPFKHTATICANLVDPANYGEYIQISPDNIEKNSGRIIDYKTVDEAGVISWNHLFSKGAILYSKIRPNLNKVAIAPFDGLCSADMYPIQTENDTRYFLYLMLSQFFVAQVSRLISNRVKMPKINQEELGSIKCIIPPLTEQREIASFLDAKCAAIDAKIEKRRKLIEQLSEYKRSLIYEVVTGKREV